MSEPSSKGAPTKAFSAADGRQTLQEYNQELTDFNLLKVLRAPYQENNEGNNLLQEIREGAGELLIELV